MALNAKADPNYVPKRINGKFAPGWSGNPGGSLEATRRSFNKDFLLALAADFKKHGAAAIEKVRKQQPAAYMKICALLVPREMKVEHSNAIKAMSDEQIEQAIEAIQTMLEQQAKVIEGTAETVALPAPDVIADGPNKVMDAADTAVWPRERKPRKCVPSPAGT
jgi:2-oxoglutarate dehydrogenase complex dehydrogenase (E1) component-like enzyme